MSEAWTAALLSGLAESREVRSGEATEESFVKSVQRKRSDRTVCRGAQCDRTGAKPSATCYSSRSAG